MSAPVETPGSDGRSSRRSHRKSRTGCAFCKKRRIKCDEKKPACSHCLRRSLLCSFSAGQSPEATSAAAVSPPELDVHDMELFHHFCFVTAASFGTEVPAAVAFWSRIVPQWAFQHSYLLHGLLAIAGFHKARMVATTDWNVTKAHRHWDAALRLATPMLQRISESTVAPLWLFATLTYLRTFMSGPEPGNYLLFRDQGFPDWLILFRGILSLEAMYDLNEIAEASRNESMKLVFSQSSVKLSDAGSGGKVLSPSIERALASLEILIETETEMRNCDNKERLVYQDAFRLLRAAFASVFGSGDSTVSSTSTVIFAWLHRVSDDYLYFAREKRPLALVLFAYYIVLMQQLEMGRLWVFEGWPEHLIAGISAALLPPQRGWIAWPLERVAHPYPSKGPRQGEA